MGRAWPPRTALLLLAVLVAGGCHNYRPISSPAVGSVVRVHVPVTSALADPNAPPESVSIEGNVLANGDTLVLATETRRELGAFREVIQFDTVRLAPNQRTAVELREFSRGKSVLLGLVIAGGAAGFAAAAFGFGGGSDGEGSDNVPPSPSVVISGSVVSTIWGLIGRSP